MEPTPTTGGQGNDGSGPNMDGLHILKTRALEWLGPYDCSRRARGDGSGCISGVDKMVKNIGRASPKELVDHLFHACLFIGFNADGVFGVKSVETRASSKNKKTADMQLCDNSKAAKPKLFVEAWYGKSEFGHRMDDLTKAGSGAIGVRLEDDMRAHNHELGQLHPDHPGLVVNYAPGIREPHTLPIAKLWPKDKCIITVRSNLRAYLYGQDGSPCIGDARRICDIFGWLLSDMRGKTGTDILVVARNTVRASARASARIVNRRPARSRPASGPRSVST